MVPRNEVENLEVVDIAEDYYKVKLSCLAFSFTSCISSVRFVKPSRTVARRSGWVWSRRTPSQRSGRWGQSPLSSHQWSPFCRLKTGRWSAMPTGRTAQLLGPVPTSSLRCWTGLDWTIMDCYLIRQLTENIPNWSYYHQLGISNP